MLAPHRPSTIVNENAPHPGAQMNHGARKQGLQAKQGLNGAPISPRTLAAGLIHCVHTPEWRARPRSELLDIAGLPYYQPTPTPVQAAARSET